MKNKFRLGVLIAFLLGGSCAPINLTQDNFSNEPPEIDDNLGVDYSDFGQILKKTGCSDFRSYVWNYIYRIVSIEDGKPPPYHTVKQRLVQKIQYIMKDYPADQEYINNFAMRFVEIYALVTELMDHYNNSEVEETLVQIEYNISTENQNSFVSQMREVLDNLDADAKALNSQCLKEDNSDNMYGENQPTENVDRHGNHSAKDSSNDLGKWDILWFHKMRKTLHPLVYGARKVMSTAYQSCSVLDMPLMSTSFEDTKGIRRVSRHSNGRGWRRDISNLNAVNNTHYYLNQLSVPNSNQCFNIHSAPLIYDFGGKPSTSMRSINLFKNSGSGSNSLGIDCSGFVTSAMASAGLRLKHGVFIRPIHVKGINAWMFKKSQRNKFSCLQKQQISPENPLRSGDIVASNTHIFIVEFVHDDPFSLKAVQSSAECHSKRIKLDNMKFSIIQSSPHNNGIGINRMLIGDAVGSFNTISRGLKRTASRVCYKMFGQNYHSNINEISILRHASDDPACRDREIYLDHQECLESCEPEYAVSI